jgi:uncharacterized protein YmfQ (DUF2313 family)
MNTTATLPAWRQALQALLPPGRALSRELGAVLTRVLEAIAATLLVAQLRLERLQTEFNPARASAMLPDWERLLGLPDECMTGLALMTAKRQQIALQRLLERGGQSRAYFIGLAEQLGEPGVTITEFFGTPERFTWRMNIPHAADDSRLMNCEDNCESALDMYTPSVLECVIGKRKPAHTQVLFAYTS